MGVGHPHGKCTSGFLLLLDALQHAMSHQNAPAGIQTQDCTWESAATLARPVVRYGGAAVTR